MKRVRFLFVALSLALLMQACGPSVKTHLEQATTYQEAGDSDKAIAEYLAALELDPENIEAHTNLGAIYVEQGLMENAISEFEEVLRLDPTQVEALGTLGAIYYDLEEYEKAIPLLEKTVELASDDQATTAQGILDEANKQQALNAHLEQASTYNANGDFDKAIAEYEAVIELDPDNAIYHLLLGKLYYDQERFDEAVVEYKKVAQLAALDPNLMITVPSAGDVYYEQGEYEKAIPEYLASLELSPDNIDDYMSLAFSYYKVEQYDNAVKTYEEVLKLDPNHSLAHFVLGSIYYYKLSENEKALPLLERYLELEPDTPYKAEVDGIIADISSKDIYTGKSGASIVLKNDTLTLILDAQKCESATEVDTKIIYNDQDFSENHVWGKEEWKVTACSETSLYLVTFTGDGVGGTYVNAEWIDSPSETSSDTSTLTAEEHLELAAEYYDAGETDKEIAEYLAVIELEPNNVEAHAYLGLTYYADKGNVEDAIAELEIALGIDANDGTALLFLGAVYYGSEQYEKAIPLLEKFMELYPNDDSQETVKEWLTYAKSQIE